MHGQKNIKNKKYEVKGKFTREQATKAQREVVV